MPKRIAVIVLSIILSLAAVLHTAAASVPGTSAQSSVLLEANERKVLCAKNADAKMAMASTTKIMTALVAVEHCPVSKEITVAPDAVGVEGSSVYLFAGEVLTLSDLLYSLLLASANDAAAAIAIEIGGSIEGFCELMNAKARELGLTSTNFTNPHGLYDEEHYTTAHELAIITAEALSNDTLRNIFATKKITVTPPRGNARVLVNHNKMLSLYPGAIGVKTGFTKKSGRCLVSAAERDGLTLICVTLNAPDDWRDHTALLDWGFDSFNMTELCRAGQLSFSLPVAPSIRSAARSSTATPIPSTLFCGI